MSSCFRSAMVLRRIVSMALRLAAAMSQAPGLFGTPDSGHCSSAATSASCARSSAKPTSRTMRVRPAISFADSIRQTASIARWVLVSVTETNHTTSTPRGKSPLDPPLEFSDLPHFALAIARDHEELLGPLDRVLLRVGLEQPEPADDLFRLGERAIRDGKLSFLVTDARAK